jgi:hypothetical protein
LSDASDADAAETGVGGELLDNLKAINEKIITEARATAAIMIRFCSMVETRADFRICAGLN